MPRVRADLSVKRLRELAEAALQVFCRQGFERSQVADVARVMGVAVGTVYLYVESKEALFDLAVRFTAEENDGWLEALEVPVTTPEPGSTLAFITEVFGRERQWPCLEAALAGPPAADVGRELEGILREQCRLMVKHRSGLILLTRSALEFPGLAAVFVFGLRQRLLEELTRYLTLRVEAGLLRRPPDLFTAAALLTQTIAWAILQRPWDPGLAHLDGEAVEQGMMDLMIHGLLPSA